MPWTLGALHRPPARGDERPYAVVAVTFRSDRRSHLRRAAAAFVAARRPGSARRPYSRPVLAAQL